MVHFPRAQGIHLHVVVWLLSHVRLFCNPTDCSPPGSLCMWDFPAKNTGVGCHFFLQGSSPPRDRTHISCVSCIGRPIYLLRPPRTVLTRKVLLSIPNNWFYCFRCSELRILPYFGVLTQDPFAVANSDINSLIHIYFLSPVNGRIPHGQVWTYRQTARVS